jgi:hypothetical protein
MSIQAVEAELGTPSSRMATGPQEVLLYNGNQKLEFLNGSLTSINGRPVPSATEQAEPNAISVVKEQGSTHLLDSDLELPVMRDQQTITESTQSQLQFGDLTFNNSPYGDLMKKLSGQLQDYESTQQSTNRSDATNHLLLFSIGFMVEFIITLLILKVAFRLCRFPCLWHQIGLLSIVFAASGAIVAFLIDAGLFNPIRLGLSFIVLLVLIQQFTDVREWATAIKIAITARLISIGVMWLALAGAMMLFGI